MAERRPRLLGDLYWDVRRLVYYMDHNPELVDLYRRKIYEHYDQHEIQEQFNMILASLDSD